MTNDNLKLWNQVRTPDPKFTKAFTRPGGFKGTSISANYLVQRATEVWGQIGKGWGVDEVSHEIIDGTWHSYVRVWYKEGDQVYCVYQWGGTNYRIESSVGVRFDDEAAKKSMTDGMTKCLSQLGFGADVHMGMFDDVKYVNDARARFAEEAEPKKEEPRKDAGDIPLHQSFKSSADRKRLADELKAAIETSDDPTYLYEVERAEEFARVINGHLESQLTVDRWVKSRKEFLAHKELMDAGMKPNN
jgi:hypothetical protein